MSLPFEQIRADIDRSHTADLLQRLLAGPGDDELGQVAWALGELGDPRACDALLAVVEDGRCDARVRRAASSALAEMGAPVERARLRAWFASGDEVLERAALARFERDDAEIVCRVAHTEGHRLRADALGSMCFGFEEPRFQRIKIAALSSADAVVRAQACDALLWDQPSYAEAPLIDATGDGDERVAIAATDTLRYYASCALLLRLDELCKGASGRLREVAQRSFDDVVASFFCEMVRAKGGARRRLEAYAAPVWHLIEGAMRDEGDDSEGEGGAVGAKGASRAEGWATTEQIDELLDGGWGPQAALRARWGLVRWGEIGVGERARLASCMVMHIDPWGRERACAALSAWGDVDALLELSRDRWFMVRKAAVYHLGQVEAPSAGAARFAWQHLHEPSTTSTHAYETLATYVHHAAQEEARERLVALARGDERASVQREAIASLVALEARAELSSLMGLLSGPPLVVWSSHRALIDAAVGLGIGLPDLRWLGAIDEVWLQASLAGAWQVRDAG